MTSVFTVPMRNWNYSITACYLNISFSFYSTYEELKPPHLPIQNPLHLQFLQYLWGIETYLVIYCLYVIIWVFTVPMRNWNLLFWLFYILLDLLFLQYLWGIETDKKNILLNSRILFLQYLWGIETYLLPLPIRCKVLVFTVLMRNWNF